MNYLSLHFSFMDDKLSLYFAFLIVLILIPIGIYSVGYAREYRKNYSVKYLWAMMIVFALSMIGVVVSGDGITFMVFWEIMSISSFFLVVFEYKNKETLKSGILYFIMTHISGLILMIMFGYLVKFTGSLDFSSITALSKSITVHTKLIIFILALSGFGAKAGLMPLHAWLPKAHPSAPSNISALMSGVMIKVALYGFIRVTFMFLGDLPAVFGAIVMIIGAVTAVFSVFNAVLQQDIKKLLAYSSSENIGIIFGTLGLAMVFGSFGLERFQAITLTAALFHIMNHAVFKSLLFSSAGSVLYASGTKNMNELGGLYKKMRFAAVCAFVGTAAISAVPPLNGFASEIMIFKSFIEAGTAINNISIVLIIILCGILFAITGGTVIYSSVKSFGITYLGEPRSEKAINTHKIPLSMNLGMGILSLLAVILGVFSWAVVNYISDISGYVVNFDSSIRNVVNPETTVISLILICVTAIVVFINKRGSESVKVETKETWGCGFNDVKPLMQYSGSGYSQPAARFAGNIAGYKKEAKVQETVYLRQKTSDIVEKYLYRPLIKSINYISEKIVKIHYGKIQLYILYIFISLIAALIMVVKFA